MNVLVIRRIVKIPIMLRTSTAKLLIVHTFGFANAIKALKFILWVCAKSANN